MNAVLLNQLLPPLIFLALTIGLLGIWHYYPRFLSARWFAVAYSFAALGFGMEALVPADAHLAILFISDCFFTLATAVFACGVYVRFNRPVPFLLLAGMSLAVISGQSFYRFVEPDVHMRAVVITLGSCLLLLVATLAIRSRWRQWTDRTLIMLVAIFAMSLFANSFFNLFFMPEPFTPESFSRSRFLATINLIVGASGLLIALVLFIDYGVATISDLRIQTETDGLSGLLNRRGFELRTSLFFNDESRPAKSGKTLPIPLSLIVADIDNFKEINDTNGHEVGDDVIMVFGSILRSSARNSDVVGRVGGEEFCLLLPDASLQVAQRIAERCRSRFASAGINRLSASTPHSASFGVAERQPGEDYQHLFRRADKALYKAKENGKNRVEAG